MAIELAQLSALCTKPELWLAPLNDAMLLFDIAQSEQRIAMFLAQCAHESARFARVEEDLRYSPSAILRTWPNRFTPDQAVAAGYDARAVANRAYALRGGNGPLESGDGYNFRGRGPIQITFRKSYHNCGVALGLPLIEQPDLLLDKRHGAAASAWFWQVSGCNEVADEGDFDGVSGLVNRGDRTKPALNLEDRRRWYRIAREG